MERETADETIDTLPEYCHYRDEGCALADSCLRCHFPNCVYDRRRGKQRLLLKMRDREIARQRRAGGKAADLARKFGVTARTARRIVRKARSEGAKHGKYGK